MENAKGIGKDIAKVDPSFTFRPFVALSKPSRFTAALSLQERHASKTRSIM
jgi:hypothetical protein